MTDPAPMLLRLDGVEALYGDAILALRGVSFAIPQGSIVALLGANGAGKSTTLKAISNLLGATRGRVSKGTIAWQGESTAKFSPADLVRRGIVQVLEGRHCFPHLTVEENLLSGGFARRPGRREIRADLERIYDLFPRLRLRRRAKAGLLSGGEQQMVAIGRALMSRPILMLLDEPSMGLAPMIVEEIFEIIHRLNAEDGVTFLLAEQNAHLVLRYAHHGYVLENGHVAASGTAVDLSRRDDVSDFYLGGASTATTPNHPPFPIEFVS
ncbi:ABC transporter ATP-binding protein [Lichenihabitans sp. PAMC28606]|uniref:ABC transporter ATP-binding protein n=1 Tax=Lichenihabitans sp. PAMC28606 TaxID=2880932 RepID=UPI001D0A3DAB|nr:ABC transporter ATP-binding protein [Lichenihabitans sp. PAMC28606]UDL95633.1 ABC transporter ATP-binding protein [Lichenihabitans sp. PAMC28606]